MNLDEDIRYFIKYGRVGGEKFRELLVEDLRHRLDPQQHAKPKVSTEQSMGLRVLLDPLFETGRLSGFLKKMPEVREELFKQVLNWLDRDITLAKMEALEATSNEDDLLKKAKRMSPEAFVKGFSTLKSQLAPFHSPRALDLDGYARTLQNIRTEEEKRRKAFEAAKKSTGGNFIRQGLSLLMDSLSDKTLGENQPLIPQMERSAKLLDFLKKTGIIDSKAAREEAKEYLEKAGIPPEMLDKALEMHQAGSQKAGKRINVADVQRKFLKDWEVALKARQMKAELDAIDEKRKAFLAELYRQLEDYLKLKEVLGPISGYLGRGIDLSKGNWGEDGFEFLRRYAEMLRDDKSLQELVDLLGRMRRAEIELEEEEYEEISYRHYFTPDRALKEEVVGLRESNDLDRLLPSEAALLAEEETESIFLKKYAEQKLLTYDLQGKRSEIESESETKTRQKQKNSDKGPFILCVDTSGSMHGTPEQVAKVLSFAITKTALQENRKAYLISFSTSIQTLELTDIAHSLDTLISFLRMSFHGGTDAGPALQHALKMLQESSFQKADVLLISDFVMPEPSGQVKQGITEAKDLGTKFLALTVSSRGNARALSVFDHHWHYNPHDKGALKKGLAQLRESLR